MKTMKTMKKGAAILIVALVFGLSLAMFGFTSGLVKTAFAADAANVEMIGGASVKLNSTGIRFQSKVKKSYYDGLAEGKITGIAIIPADLLDGELNENTENAKIVKAVANPYEEGDYYVYNYALTDIPESSFGRSITARAFIKNGETYEWAANAQTRSLAYVASVALQKKSLGEANYNDDQTKILNRYIDAAVSGFTADNQQTLAVGDNVGISNLTITPKYAEDNLSDLKLVCTTNNADAISVADGKLTANKAGYALVTVALGNKIVTTKVVANEEEYVLSAAKTGEQSISFSLPEGYTADFYMDNDTKCGSIDKIILPSGTEQKLYNGYPLKIQITDGKTSFFTRPNVRVATATISTLNDWKTYIWSADAAAKVDGYFVVMNDIDQGSEAFNLTGERAVGNGFVGTVDGKGHSINLSGSNGFGLFGGMNGATVKNLTINKNGGSQGWSAGLLGAYVQNSVFENVTINITGANNDNAQLGEFTRRGVWGSKFTDFKVNIKNSKVASLFGADVSVYRGLNAKSQNKCTFSNSVIQLDAVSTMNEIGHSGKVTEDDSSHPLTVYTAEGHTPINAPSWATISTLSGIIVKQPKSISKTMDKQYLVMSDGKYSLDLGSYATGYSVESITYDGKDLGVDPSQLNIASATAGDGKDIVVVCKNENEIVTLTYPVCWVTAVINSAEDWKTYMWCEKGQTITGYYVLGKTIGGITGDTLKNPRSGGAAEAATTGGDYGFRGTLDGRGYTLSYGGSIGGGLINALGKGAIIKNLKIENNSVSKPGWKSEHIFGTVAVGATIENVTIDFNRCDYTGVETKYGPLAYDGFRNCTVKNLTINIKGKVNTIIGGSNATYFQMAGTTFTNCVINLYPGATLGEIGHTGANGEPVYCGENETIEGKTPLAGFTVNNIEATAKTLSVQDMSLAEESAAINFAEYSDYTVTSITCGEYNLGTDKNNVVLPEDIKKKRVKR